MLCDCHMGNPSVHLVTYHQVLIFYEKGAKVWRTDSIFVSLTYLHCWNKKKKDHFALYCMHMSICLLFYYDSRIEQQFENCCCHLGISFWLLYNNKLYSHQNLTPVLEKSFVVAISLLLDIHKLQLVKNKSGFLQFNSKLLEWKCDLLQVANNVISLREETLFSPSYVHGYGQGSASLVNN